MDGSASDLPCPGPAVPPLTAPRIPGAPPDVPIPPARATVKQWLGIALEGVAAAWFGYRGQYEFAALVVGLILHQLDLDSTTTRAVLAAGVAAARADHAAGVGEHTAASVETVKDQLRDIQDNPVQPGTPGWADRRA